MHTAIISGSVALLIFAATQLFLHLRSRQDLLRQKLEELFSGMNAVSAAFMDTFHAAQEKKDDEVRTAFRKLDDAFYKPRSLILFYFPYITEIWEDSVLAQAHELVAKVNEADDATKLDAKSCRQNVDKAAMYIRYLQNFLARNQDLTTETLAFQLNRLFRRGVRIRMPRDVYTELEHDGFIKDGKLGSANVEVEQRSPKRNHESEV